MAQKLRNAEWAKISSLNGGVGNLRLWEIFSASFCIGLENGVSDVPE